MLKTNELEKFSDHAHIWHRKATLLQRLNQDQIQYIEVMDLRYHGNIPTTLHHTEQALRQFLLKEGGSVFVFYANDRLRDEKSDVWKGKYEELLSKRDQTAPGTALVYGDFTNCRYDLQDLIVVKLTMDMSSEAQRSRPAGKESSQIISCSFSIAEYSSFISLFVSFLIAVE